MRLGSFQLRSDLSQIAIVSTIPFSISLSGTTAI
jgi:hypothetical protein